MQHLVDGPGNEYGPRDVRQTAGYICSWLVDAWVAEDYKRTRNFPFGQYSQIGIKLQSAVSELHRLFEFESGIMRFRDEVTTCEREAIAAQVVDLRRPELYTTRR